MAKPYTPIYDWPVKDRPNPTAKIPYAYKEDPENPLKLIPDMELLPFVERALQYINEGNTVRSVAEWLSQAAKKTITHQGIDYIWEQKCGSDPHNPIVKERRRRRREKAPKTPEEKERYHRQKELNKAAQKVGRERKKLAAIDAKIAEQERLAQIEPEEIIYPSFDEAPVIPKELENREIAFTPNPGPQTEFLAAPEREVLYGGAAGGGKAQPFNTPVYTPYGVACIGHLVIGSKVLTPTGVAKVIQVHPQGEQDIYKITMQDGSVTYATDEHLWLSKPVRDGKDRWKVRTTKQIRESNRTFVLPLTKPAQFEQTKHLPIDPYVLGCLLGDGCITTNSISYTCADQELIDKLAEKVKLVKRKGLYQYGMYKLTDSLRKLKLLGTNSYTKFIPDSYLFSSVANRKALVQGLMDTDGYVTADGKINFTSMSSTMRLQVAWLIRSLGGTAKEFKGHSLYIRHPDSSSLFSLRRKKDRCHKKNINNKIVSIEFSHRDKAVCITLDSPEQLYLTTDFIVTHNSYALLADPMRYFDHPSFRGLILRRTNDELRELKWKSKELYSKTFPDAKWKEQMSMWVFPSGAELWMTYLERDDDVLRYQGQAFSYIAIDELTQYATPFAWDYMRSRLRTTAPDLPIFMRATSNPGGPGHLWVKKMFVDPAVPGQAFNATDIETGEVLKYPDNHHDRKLRGLPLFQRRFIPAKLADNPYLMKGGEYEANLLSLPEAQKRKLLDGDWSIIEGAAFPEFSTSTHVITPYKIPSSWRKFRSADFGYSSFSAVHWFAIDPVYETLIVYRELYVSKCTAIELAQRIKQIEAEAGENVMYGVLDSSTWHQRGHNGPSIAEEMIGQGVSWRPSDRTKGSRTAGFNRLHELLKTTPYSDGKKVPGIVFFNNCRQIIADLQVIPVHPDGVDDIDDKYLSDHTYDSIRYGIMSRPRGQSPWDFEVTSISASHSPVDRVFGY